MRARKKVCCQVPQKKLPKASRFSLRKTKRVNFNHLQQLCFSVCVVQRKLTSYTKPLFIKISLFWSFAPLLSPFPQPHFLKIGPRSYLFAILPIYQEFEVFLFVCARKILFLGKLLKQKFSKRELVFWGTVNGGRWDGKQLLVGF